MIKIAKIKPFRNSTLIVILLVCLAPHNDYQRPANDYTCYKLRWEWEGSCCQRYYQNNIFADLDIVRTESEKSDLTTHMGKQVLFASCHVDIMSKTVHHFQESLAKLLLDDELVDSSQGNLKTGARATYFTP